MTEAANNKRKHERFKASLQIRYQSLEHNEKSLLTKNGSYAAPGAFMAKAAETRELKMVISEDISHGGLRISTPQPLPHNAELWVNLKLPEIPIPVNALASVAWTRPSSGAYASGLKFQAINESDMQKVENFVALSQK